MIAAADDILACIGHTPLVRLARLPGAGSAAVLAKLESMNPGQSADDRTALAAVRAGELGRIPAEGGGWIAEPADSVASLSLAMIAAARGHALHAFAPRDAPYELKETLRLYGAKVEICPPGGAREAAQLFQHRRPGAAFAPRLFNAEAHAAAHAATAGEILEALEAPLDALVVPVRTGAALLGLARAFRERSPATRVIAVAGASKPSPSWPLGEVPGAAQALCASVEVAGESEAWEMRGLLAQEEGILSGPAGAAAVVAALRVARQIGPQGSVAVVIPDSGERWFGVEEARTRSGVP